MDEQLTFEFDTRKPIKGYPELHWTGKRPYTSTQYYPAQLKESYGESKDGWMNKIFWGDNLQVMSHMLKDYRGKVDLIYIDPPYQENLYEPVLSSIKLFDILKDNGIIICESTYGTPMPELFEPYKKEKERRYGKIGITIYRKEL